MLRAHCSGGISIKIQSTKCKGCLWLHHRAIFVPPGLRITSPLDWGPATVPNRACIRLTKLALPKDAAQFHTRKPIHIPLFVVLLPRKIPSATGSSLYAYEFLAFRWYFTKCYIHTSHVSCVFHSQKGRSRLSRWICGFLKKKFFRMLCGICCITEVAYNKRIKLNLIRAFSGRPRFCQNKVHGFLKVEI